MTHLRNYNEEGVTSVEEKGRTIFCIWININYFKP